MAATPQALVLSWRIGWPLYMTDAPFHHLQQFLRDHRKIVDEVAFFETISHHLYLPPEFLRKTAETLRGRIPTLKQMGVGSVGVNVLTTIGHINEAWDYLPPLPFQPMVGHDGAVSRSCACPNTPEFRRYVRDKYTLFAGAAPDFIWVDDDLRMQHHGVTYGCFCPVCLALFERKTGRRFTREALVDALNTPAETELRAAWIEHNLATLESLLADVAGAVHAVDPAIRTGLMTAGADWSTYSGLGFDRWFPALRAVKARPGGGFYTDDVPSGMYHKAMDIGRQCALLPAEVTERQYELENFPYATMGKSAASVINECTLAIGSGCNGVAFNALGFCGDCPLDEKEPLARHIEQARPFWEALARQVEGTSTCGLWPAWHPRLMARRTLRPGEDWLAHSPFHQITVPQVMAGIGLPLSAARCGCGVLLSGRVAEAFSDDELRDLMSGGVLMDAFALDVLGERGLLEWAGVRIGRWLDNGVAERLTDDPLNRPHARAVRDIRNEFWGDPFLQSALLEPLRPGVRLLSEMETYFGDRIGPCVTAFENDLGGRVVVMGFAPWRFVNLTIKRAQILNAADWAARGSTPVRIREVVPLVPIIRLSEDRCRGAVVLLNAGFDRIEEVTLELRVPDTPVRLAAPGREPVAVRVRDDDGIRLVTLNGLEPWRTVALLLG